MKLNIKKYAALMACACGLTITSCVGDLDVTPINPQQTQVANDDALFNKLYATFSLTGQQGNAGKPDIPSSVMSDEGSTQYFRMQWYLNEFTSDEAAWTWSGNDGGVQELMYNNYTASNAFALGLYYRLYFDITLCNSYINDIGKDPMRLAEARFIRAYNYASVLDVFGAGPFCTSVSSENAVYYNRQQLFDFVESELLAIENQMAEPGKNTYGRADKVAVWLLLSRLYLNAEVYTGKERYDDAMAYANKVLNNGYYHLNLTGATNPATGEKYSAYQMLFLADNDKNGAQYEDILPVLQDGITTKTDGGTQLLILGSYANDNAMDTDVPSGTNLSWGKCLQVKGKLVDQFFNGAAAPETGSIATMTAAANDDRALFYSKGYSQYLTEVDDLSKCFTSVKFRNVRSDGGATSAVDYVDTDLPLMRMAEAYLTYAEASVRKLGPNSDADSKLNELRNRAHATPLSGATLDDICAEWSREFWFEGRRRSDLIRFNKFAGQSDYKWEYMGGEANGTSFSSYRKVFAIPQTDLSNNPNLKQNEGYN